MAEEFFKISWYKEINIAEKILINMHHRKKSTLNGFK